MEKDRRRYEKRIALAVLLVLFLAVVGWLLVGEFSIVIELAAYMSLVLFALYQIYHRLREQMNVNHRGAESLLSLFATVRPDRPLPDTGKWAASPDLLKKLAEVVLRIEPELVVETGSGVSTIVIAYCLKRIGKGRLISLEHDAEYVEVSRDLVSFHGLQNIATIVHAPLRPITIGASEWLWYDMDQLRIDRGVDLLFVDGPPETTQPLARYPALPLFIKHLHAHSYVLLDDADRKDERKVLARWREEFPDMTPEHLDVEKGAVLMKMRATAPARREIKAVAGSLKAGAHPEDVARESTASHDA